MAELDYFLKIDRIAGESTDARHRDEIELESFSWGEANPGAHATGGAGAGKVQMQDFHFAMKVNKASPKLMLACATGRHIKSATLVARMAGKAQLEFLQYSFTDLLVTSYQTGGHADDLPIDEVSFSFGKIEVEYRPQKVDGTLSAPVRAGWDVRQNKPA